MPRQESKLGKDNDEGAGDRKPKERSVLKGREEGRGKKKEVRERPAPPEGCRGTGDVRGFFRPETADSPGLPESARGHGKTASFSNKKT
ncbi:hypothetical protein B4135_3905 [Caldibacillus debilis]|uniref:Uncharacterized protein n=1 Tax=Caldibacillus debilis TaxID=301148 RepID=A0A150L9M2_9BACI|nr:hypothetical protein B4135_3905 [Caldibacillus debilis]